jgi:hypothetical protein
MRSREPITSCQLWLGGLRRYRALPSCNGNRKAEPHRSRATWRFTAGHAYQGRSGALRAALGGVFFTLLVLATGSLIPAMVLHALIDAGSGVIAWLVLRDEPVNGEFASAGESR